MQPVSYKFMSALLCSVLIISNYPALFDLSDSDANKIKFDAEEITVHTNTRGNEPVTFTNVTKNVGLAGVNANFFSWTDYDNDGNFDLLMNGKRLFKNEGPPDYNFTEVTSSANLTGSFSYGVWGDYNDDGYLDYYACAGKNKNDALWKNNGNGTFTDVTMEAGNIKDIYPTSAAGWGDFDRDGDIDLYVANGEDWNSGNPIYYPDKFYENNGNGTFTDITVSAGVDESSSPYYGRGVAWGDYDNDGWLDLYISNYRIQPNYLYRNNHDGTFTNVAYDLNTTGDASYYQGSGPYYGHTIGSSWGDLNNDGYLDLWVSNLVHKYVGGSDIRGYICDDSNIFQNRGAPFFNFTDIRPTTGIPYKPIGGQGVFIGDEFWFNAALADIDNDGDLDVYIPQGGGEYYNVSYAYSFLFRNNNDGTFTDITTAAGVRTWCTYGGAWADYNNDGFVDLITSGKVPQNGGKYEVKLYKNNGNSNNWLHVMPEGGNGSNTDAIGARVMIKIGSEIQIREVEGGMGAHSSQNSLPVEFGLGSATIIDELIVCWPSGKLQKLKNIASNQLLKLDEPSETPIIDTISSDKYNVMEDEIFNLTAELTIPIGKNVNSYWDTYGNGIKDQEPFSYPFSGMFNARLYVWLTTDDYGFMDSTKYITVTNINPQAKAGDDITVYEDEIITFNASSSIDSHSDVGNLLYKWDFDDGTDTGPTWLTTPFVNHSYPSDRVFDVTLYVKDDDGAVSTDTVRVNVNNKEPECDAGSDLIVAEDEELTFYGIGNDTLSDRPGLLYKWEFGDGNVRTLDLEPNATHTYDEQGTYIVTLMVSDGDDTSSDTLNVTVYNPTPKASVMENKSADEDEKILFEGWGSDNPSDNSSLLFGWDFGDGNSTWLPSTGTKYPYKYAEAGVYNATFIVKDDDGATGNATVVITIYNVAPEAIVGPDQKRDEDEEIELTGSGKDTESDMASLEYRWNFGDGSEQENWSSSPNSLHSYSKAGTYTAILKVRDNNGAEDEEILYVDIDNVDPTADISAEKTKPNEYEPVKFSGSKSHDTPSDIATLNYTWLLDDKIIAFGCNITYRFEKSGVQTIKLLVVDDDEDQDLDSAEITVINVKPDVKFNISSTKGEAGTVFSFNANGTVDTVNDMDSLEFVWDLGDGNFSFGPSVTHVYEKADTYTVKLTVSDGEETSILIQVVTVEEDDIPTSIDEGKTTKDEGGISTTVIIAAVIITIVLILILLLLFMKVLKPKPKQEEPQQPESPTMMQISPENLVTEDAYRSLAEAQTIDTQAITIPIEGAPTQTVALPPSAQPMRPPFCGQCGTQSRYSTETGGLLCPNCNIAIAGPFVVEGAAVVTEEEESGSTGEEKSEREEDEVEESEELKDAPGGETTDEEQESLDDAEEGEVEEAQEKDISSATKS